MMGIKTTYSRTKRELIVKVDDKRMIFDIMALPFKEIFEHRDRIYDVHFLMDSSLWIGYDGLMEQYELKILE